MARNSTSQTSLPPSLRLTHLWPAADLAELAQVQALATRKPIDFWQPQPKQRELLAACGLLDALTGGKPTAPAAGLIGYGGAAFGGKTEGLVGLGLVACMMIPGVQVGLFRREFTDLEGPDGPITRSQLLYPGSGGRYNETKHRWAWTNGARFYFCHCQHEKDVYGYQSAAFDILLIDEATHFSWFMVDYLLTRNRSSRQSKIIEPFAVFCTNPGNVGHHWYMQVFGIDPNGYYENNRQPE